MEDGRHRFFPEETAQNNLEDRDQRQGVCVLDEVPREYRRLLEDADADGLSRD